MFIFMIIMVIPYLVPLTLISFRLFKGNQLRVFLKMSPSIHRVYAYRILEEFSLGIPWVHPGSSDPPEPARYGAEMRVWKPLECPSMDGWVREMRSVHIMKYYPASEKEGNLDICDNMDEPLRMLC